MVLMFLNGAAMRGGPLHGQLCGAPLVGIARSAPAYRYFSVGARFPAMYEVPERGGSVLGEVYDVPLAVLHESLLPAEPEELELGTIRLADGAACLATVLRERFLGHPSLVDITGLGDWRAYVAS